MTTFKIKTRIIILCLSLLSFQQLGFTQEISNIEKSVLDLCEQELTDSAITMAESNMVDIETKSTRLRAEAYYIRGLAHSYSSSHDLTLKDIKKALNILDGGDHYLAYRCRSYIAKSYSDLYEFDSLKMELDILKEHEQYADSLTKALNYYSSFRYYHRGAQKDIALDHILKAKRIYEEMGLLKLVATMDSNIGEVYFALENDSLALHYQNKSLKYHLEKENFYEASYTYLNRGTYYNGLEKWDLAEKDLLACLRLSELTDNLSNIANVNQLLSNTYANTGRYEEAEKAIDLSMVICEKYDIEICKVYAYMHYADLYRLSKDWDKAIVFGERLVKFPTKTYINTVYEGYGILNQAYAAKGNYKNAHKAAERERILSDSLFNIENQEALSHIKEQYEREKNLVQINELKSEAKIESLKKNGLIGGLGILGVMSLLIINREVQRRKNSKLLHEAEINLKETEEVRLKEELAFKNRELTTKALHVAQKNEVLQKLKSELEVMAQQKGAQECVREVVSTLRLEKTIDSNWEQFTQQFTDLNPMFYKGLITRFPDMTKGELRLAALLRMNLTSKEIANMLNISDDGVKKARQRIRKKLQLQSEDSLENYILSV